MTDRDRTIAEAKLELEGHRDGDPLIVVPDRLFRALIALAEQRGPAMPEEPTQEVIDLLSWQIAHASHIGDIYRALRAHLLAQQQESRSPAHKPSGSSDSDVPFGNSGNAGERDTGQGWRIRYTDEYGPRQLTNFSGGAFKVEPL